MLGLFGFVDDVKKSFFDIYKIIVNTKEAPSLSMTFDNKYLKGTYKVVDLTWYAPYKEFGDNVICMFVYVLFIWYIFNNLSSIIRGSTFGNSRFADVQEHVIQSHVEGGNKK